MCHQPFFKARSVDGSISIPPPNCSFQGSSLVRHQESVTRLHLGLEQQVVEFVLALK